MCAAKAESREEIRWRRGRLSFILIVYHLMAELPEVVKEDSGSGPKPERNERNMSASSFTHAYPWRCGSAVGHKETHYHFSFCEVGRMSCPSQTERDPRDSKKSRSTASGKRRHWYLVFLFSLSRLPKLALVGGVTRDICDG